MRKGSPAAPTRVTLQDVAAAAGVSAATASRVLGREQAGLVRPEVREQVQAAAARLQYRPNLHASSLRRGRSRTVALLLRANELAISAERLNAVERAVWEREYQVLLLHCGVGLPGELQALERLSSYRVDGVICSPNPHPDVVERVRALDAAIPVVTLWPLPGAAFDCVTVDRAHGAYLGARHLLQLGHRRLGAIMRLDLPRSASAAPSRRARPQWQEIHPSIQFRIEGMRRACAEAGCRLDEDLIAYREERVYAAGHAGVQELWEQCRRPPTALLCTNDQVAIGALRAFQELGVRVPEEVALVGFDNLPEGAFARVPLTTLAQPLEEQARQAVALLFDRIEQARRQEEVTSVALPPRLVVRESCGAQPGGTRTP
jgi:LacI family transcriptional regulator